METLADYGIYVSNDHGTERTTCPECSKERRKSNDKCLSVNITDGTFCCHHCGYSGGLKKKKPEIYALPSAPVYKEKQVLPDNVVEWFKGRGITKDVLERNKIGYAKVFMPQENKEVNAIQFPYFDGNNVVNIKSRDGNKNFRMEKGAERVLYGLNDIADELIVVEGEIDKLSCEVAGFKNCVSVPDGAPSVNTKNYSTKFSFLEHAEKSLANVSKFIIAVDNDAPGCRLASELIRRFGPEKCYQAKWPEGCKDANEVLVKHGIAYLMRSIEEATPVPVAGMFSVLDIERRIIDVYNHGFNKGEKTGWKELDKFYNVRAGEWTVVTGQPGHGKSEFLDALMVNLANAGWSFGVCSMENYPLERHFAKIAEKFINMPFIERVECMRMGRDDLDAAISWAKEWLHFIMPQDDDMSVDGVLKIAKAQVYRNGINGLIIDPWNELDHFRAQNITETEYISKALTKIRKFAREYNVHVWVVAHPTKLQKNKDGKYPVPTPYDISGSAHWRNKADNAISVYRPQIVDYKDPSVEIHVQKIRFKEIGRVGMAELRYEYITGRYL